MSAAHWLPLIWAGLIAFAVMAYVVLDGFDLGVGILFAVHPEREDRDVMVNSIAPMWDGNETWLVLGGGGLFAAFPLAYAVVMPALYPTIIAMLLGLIFRGVAFEFRFRAGSARGRAWWDFAFFAGSTVAAFAQGLTLGGLLQGIHIEGRAYAGGWWDWLNAFTLLCGVAVVVGYALLGACWLVWRCSGALQRQARLHADVLAVAVLALIVAVSLWTPFLNHVYWRRWFALPGILFAVPVPILLAVLAGAFFLANATRRDLAPLLCVLGWFLLCFAGLGISLYPMMVPPGLSIFEAAAPPASQGFLLVGASVLVPIILAYTGYSWYVFRGKVGADTHYH
jgi:cytochrome bd ubiquinol oxidase subunit II